MIRNYWPYIYRICSSPGFPRCLPEIPCPGLNRPQCPRVARRADELRYRAQPARVLTRDDHVGETWIRVFLAQIRYYCTHGRTQGGLWGLTPPPPEIFYEVLEKGKNQRKIKEKRTFLLRALTPPNRKKSGNGTTVDSSSC